ncbi:acyl-[acyl-carrier-protein] thioesterase [Sphaerochaeta sp.]|uniref:acyl-[acyl-carrier-protein] thioesterase n=1 Tax=Sphaerochaeta sp. TaxID=1972642 RepID=UPI002FC705B3
MSRETAMIDDGNVAHSAFTTYSYETDCFAEARLAFYFQIVQEVAGMHAAQRGCSIPAMHKEGKTWVITRSHMEVFRYTQWPEPITVETWAQQPIRLHLPRAVKGYDGQGNPLFVAKTHWAILDLDTARPCRPLDMSLRIGLPPLEDEAHHLDMNLPKRSVLETGELTHVSAYKPSIAYLDTDRNHHVNNISYLNWALESLPPEFRNRYKVVVADLSFQRQTFLGDDLTVHTFSLDPNALEAKNPQLEHQIIRTEADGGTTVVWEGSTKWNPREDLR